MDVIYEATRRLEASMDSWKVYKGLPRAQSRCVQYMKLHKRTLVKAYAEEFSLPKRVVEEAMDLTGLILDPDALIDILNDMSLTEEYE